jgi:hypothetical protein
LLFLSERKRETEREREKEREELYLLLLNPTQDFAADYYARSFAITAREIEKPISTTHFHVYSMGHDTVDTPYVFA